MRRHRGVEGQGRHPDQREERRHRVHGRLRRERRDAAGPVPRQLQLVRAARQRHRGGRRHPHGAVGGSRAGSGRRLHDLEPRHHVRRHRVRRLLPGRRHLPSRQPAVPPRERQRRALHERGPVLPHELRRRREPARPLLVDRLGRQLLGRHRAVRHLRLLAPVPRAVGHRVQRRRVRLRGHHEGAPRLVLAGAAHRERRAEEARHARRAGESDEVRRRPNRHVQGHHRTL